jgi:hypothetical protein
MTEEKKPVADPMAAIEDDTLEIVAVPAPNVKPPARLKKGTMVCEGTQDSDGCMHYRVPKSIAPAYLHNAGGMKFVLVGGADTYTYKYRKELYFADETVVRHTKRRTTHGKVIWEPTKLIEA